MSLFSIRTSALPDSAHVVSFRGVEAISALYDFEIHVLVPDSDCADLDLRQVVGERATLEIEPNDSKKAGVPVAYHGVFAEIELVHALFGKALLRARLVPELWYLTQTYHSRMFTKKAVPDIIKAVLDDGGLASDYVKLKLDGTYAAEEHVCQYHESHYDFLARWLEREGMYFYFDFSGDSEVLIISDKNAFQEPSLTAPVRYFPVAGQDVSAGASLSAFRARHNGLPASVTMRDYDYGNPALDVSGQADVASGILDDVVIHGARFFTPDEGARLAALRAEELLAGEEVFEASGTVYGIRPGYTFDLEDHPEGALNQSYLVLSARHEGRQSAGSSDIERLLGLDFGDGYRVHLTAIAANVQVRRAAASAWPRARGFELGVIDGPADSEYAQIDDAGRYAVKIHFDESDLKKGSASTRVRMMQPHAGAPEGFHFPLRKGTEVAIGFLGGDPDRPVIAGALPNAHNPSPVTAKNASQNVIQTGGRSRIEIEDKVGSQYVDMWTPPNDTFVHLGVPHSSPIMGDHTHYIVKNTKGDCLFDIGSNQDINVGGELTETVKGAVDETYQTMQLTQIKGPQTTKVSADVDEIYKSLQLTAVSQATTEIYSQGQKSTVGGVKIELYNNAQDTKVSGGLTDEDYTGPHVKVVSGATTQLHTGDLKTLVSGPVLQNYSSTVNFDYGDTRALWASLLWVVPGGITINAPNWQVFAPTKQRVFVSFEPSFAKVTDHKWTSASTTGLKIEGTSSANGVTVAKFEATGVNVAIDGPKFEKGGPKIEVAALWVCVTSLHLVK